MRTNQERIFTKRFAPLLLYTVITTHVVHASSVNDFRNKLDAHWSNQEMVYNYQIEISGTGSRSNFQ